MAISPPTLFWGPTTFCLSEAGITGVKSYPVGIYVGSGDLGSLLCFVVVLFLPSPPFMPPPLPPLFSFLLFPSLFNLVKFPPLQALIPEMRSLNSVLLISLSC